MAKVKHKAGFINTDGILTLTWTSDTTANIMWQNGAVWQGEFDEWGATILKMIIDQDQEWTEKQINGLRDKGYFWREMELAENQENLEDYRKQRKELRDKGIYASKVEAGTFHYEIIPDDGKRRQSGSFYFGPGEKDTTPL